MTNNSWQTKLLVFFFNWSQSCSTYGFKATDLQELHQVHLKSFGIELPGVGYNYIYATVYVNPSKKVLLVHGRHLRQDHVLTLSYIGCRNHLLVWSNCTWLTVNCLNVNNAPMLPKKFCVGKVRIILIPFKKAWIALNKSMLCVLKVIQRFIHGNNLW